MKEADSLVVLVKARARSLFDPRFQNVVDKGRPNASAPGNYSSIIAAAARHLRFIRDHLKEVRLQILLATLSHRRHPAIRYALTL